jgi:hypothetical protein
VEVESASRVGEAGQPTAHGQTEPVDAPQRPLFAALDLALTKTADEILEPLTAYGQRINDSRQ